jgi:hypothetical protein
MVEWGKPDPGIEAGLRAWMRVLGNGPGGRSARLAGAEILTSMAELPALLELLLATNLRHVLPADRAFKTATDQQVRRF